MTKEKNTGNVRLQAYMGKDENGKRIYVSFTAPTEREAERMRQVYITEHKGENLPENITVGRVVDNYIEFKRSKLSPSTIVGYMVKRKNLAPIENVKIRKLSDDDIEDFFENLRNQLSDKTAKNVWSLFHASMHWYNRHWRCDYTMEHVKSKKMPTPTIPEISLIMESIKNTSIELPISLALYMGMRCSEVFGLQWSDVDMEARTIHICHALVLGEYGYELKGTKTDAGDRWLLIPPRVYDLLKREVVRKGPVVKAEVNAVRYQWYKMLNELHMHRYGLHRLRSAFASVAAMTNAPDSYLMSIGGWTSEDVMRSHYIRTFTEEEHKYMNAINQAFDSISMQRKMQRKKAESAL